MNFKQKVKLLIYEMLWLFEKHIKYIFFWSWLQVYIIDSQINQYVYSSEIINIIYVFNVAVKSIYHYENQSLILN
jgi:hypothetical protein